MLKGDYLGGKGLYVDYTEWEFVLVDEEIQKKLNQWRHKYYIRILNMVSKPTTAGYSLVLLIARKEIFNEHRI